MLCVDAISELIQSPKLHLHEQKQYYHIPNQMNVTSL